MYPTVLFCLLRAERTLNLDEEFSGIPETRARGT